MTGTVAITDHGWYEFLRSQPNIDEVNFWTPSSHWSFKGEVGSPFFFKLKAKYKNAICGFAFFARYAALPDWLAWDTFGVKNGLPTLEAMRDRIGAIRNGIQFKNQLHADEIGCILLSQPVFFAENELVAGPKDWPPANLRNKRYSLTEGEGRRIWEECVERTTARMIPILGDQPVGVAEEIARFGAPQLVQPRLGQGLFRVSVLDAYGRACAVTQEHSLPALEASHIKPYGKDGPHAVSNGILLRADLHRLFDKGYLTVTSDFHVEVSARLKADYDNGKTYYPMQGQRLILPLDAAEKPNPEYLEWHNENVYRAA
jgi:putative restriction endonuclease